jgi:ribonuclease HI
MLITLFTDVSFCAETNMCAYAIWAKANGRTLRYSNMFKRSMRDVNLAEACAIINGVVISLKSIQPRAAKIIAQTDSLSAITLLTTREHPSYGGLAEIMKAKLHDYDATIEYRHVKGHRGTRTPRNAVNTWCNAECRRVLQQARQALAGNTLIDRE